MTTDVIAFAEEVVAHTVVMPHLFGVPEAKPSGMVMAQAVTRICISKEFNKLV